MQRFWLFGKHTRLAGVKRCFSSSTAFLESAEALFNAQKTQKAKIEKANVELLSELNDEKLLRDGVYKHPYCTSEYPLSINNDDWIRVLLDISGWEQTSPHYQSVEEYGKWFTYFLLSFGFCFVMRDHFNHAFGYCMLNMVMGAEIYLYMAYYYIIRNNIMSIPNPWKYMWIQYNIHSMVDNLYEDLENTTIERQKQPLHQVDFYRLHKEFLGMKAKLLNHHLKVSKQQLKKHAYERVNSMLKMVEQFENDNFSKEFNTLLTESIENVYRELKGPEGDSIRKQSLESAILGISKGKMTYEQDPILPLVLKNIEEFENKVKNMTQEEKIQMVQLRKEQKAAIREQDKSREKSFLTSPPPLKHPRILQSPKFKQFFQH